MCCCLLFDVVAGVVCCCRGVCVLFDVCGLLFVLVCCWRLFVVRCLCVARRLPFIGGCCCLSFVVVVWLSLFATCWCYLFAVLRLLRFLCSLFVRLCALFVCRCSLVLLVFVVRCAFSVVAVSVGNCVLFRVFCYVLLVELVYCRYLFLFVVVVACLCLLSSLIVVCALLSAGCYLLFVRCSLFVVCCL